MRCIYQNANKCPYFDVCPCKIDECKNKRYSERCVPILMESIKHLKSSNNFGLGYSWNITYK